MEERASEKKEKMEETKDIEEDEDYDDEDEYICLWEETWKMGTIRMTFLLIKFYMSSLIF